MRIDGDGLYLVAGMALLVGAVLPRLLKRYAVSAPIAFLGAGVLLGFAVDRAKLSPIAEPGLTEHLAELTILVALMGVGLAIDRPIGWRRWKVTWRLLFVAMPACVAAVAGFLVEGRALGDESGIALRADRERVSPAVRGPVLPADGARLGRGRDESPAREHGGDG